MIKNSDVSKITIYTQAYNAENYIRECADSILNQTFANFEWLVLDNGSTDATSTILKEYARKDSRIKLFRNETNSAINNRILEDIIKYNINVKTKYWCSLDSDDYLHPNYLKELYEIGENTGADIVVGGTEMFHENNPQKRGKRCPPNFHKKDVKELGDIFPEVYGQFRPIWGKLFKTEVVKRTFQYRKENPIKIKNGLDTIFSLDCLAFSKSVAGLNKVLHYYRIRDNSIYHSQIDKDRYLNYVHIYRATKELLIKWDKLTNDNLKFIALVLYSSIKDCFEITQRSVSATTIEKIKVFEYILSDQYVHQIISKNGLSQNLVLDFYNIFTKIIKPLQEDDIIPTITHYTYKLYESIRIGRDSRGNKQNAFLLYISSLFDENNKNLFGVELLSQFLILIGKQSLVNITNDKMCIEFLIKNPALFREIVNSNFNNALKVCERNSQNSISDFIKKELVSIVHQVDFAWINNAKGQLDQYIKDENYEEAVNIVLKILKCSPLDKNALCYKLYLLCLNNDKITATETAEVLYTFYGDDFIVTRMVAEAYAFVGRRSRAIAFYRKAIELCLDSEQKGKLYKEIENLEKMVGE